MRRILIVLAIAFLGTGCENYDRDLWEQSSFKTQEAPRKWKPARSVPITGLIENYREIEGVTLSSPFEFTNDAKAAGKPLYDVYCAICHGMTGRSDTLVAQKMETMPFDLTESSTVELTDGEIFVKILASEGEGGMPNYRNELTDEETWQITAYLRKLQGK